MASTAKGLLISTRGGSTARCLGVLGALVIFAVAVPVAPTLAEPPSTQADSASPPPPAGAPDNPPFAAGLAREAQRQADLHTPEAAARRAASRQEYSGLGRADAWGLAKRRFPGVTTAPLFDGARPGAGPRVKDYLSPRTAITEDPATGKDLVLASTLPLVTEERGDQVPVSLDLLDEAGGFAPANALAPYVIGSQVSDGVAFPDLGVSVRLDSNSDSAGTVDQQRVFYHEVANDTDLFVAPEPLGIETFLQLRSPASPEQYTLDLDLPEGATLRRAVSANPIPGDPPETVEVVVDGEVVARVYPPLAADAAGSPVATHIEIDGTNLRWIVEHQEQDLEYPILADPEVILPNGGSWGFVNWGWGQVHYCTCSTSFGAANNDPAYYPGLYQSMPTRSYFAPGDYAEWYWQAPPQTYIYRVKFGNVQHSPFVYLGYTYSNNFNGVINPAAQWVGGMGYFDSQTGGTSPSNPFGPTGAEFSGRTLDFCYAPCTAYQGGAPEQGYAIFGLGAQNPTGPAGIYTDAYKGWVGMGWSWVYLGDNRRPSITSGQPADITSWTDDGHQSYPFFPSAHDDGLGMYSMTLSGAETGNGTQYAPYNPCSGDIYRDPCPANWPTGNRNFSYTLAEGTSSLTLQAKDVGENTASQTWTTHIDRSAPSLTPGGNLSAARGNTVGAGTYTLSVAVGDSYSGIGSVSLSVDSNPRAFTSPCSGNGNSQSCSFTFDTNADGLGAHSFSVVATDALGHPSSDSFSVTFSLPADYAECYDETKGDDAYCRLHDRESGGTSVPEEPYPVDDGEVSYAPCDADFGAGSPYCQAAQQTATASASGVTYGLADDEYGIDNLFFLRDNGAGSFKSLGIGAVRRIVPYNLTSLPASDPYYSHFRTFYRDAVDKGKEIMISFQYRDARSGLDGAGDKSYVPPMNEYKAAVRDFKAHFPRVAYFSAWNEPNFATMQPLALSKRSDGPKRLAVYTYILQKYLCRPTDARKCSVVAADMLQVGSDWKTYLDQYRDSLISRDNAAGLAAPTYWGFHPYTDVSKEEDHDGMQAFKDRIPAGKQMWLTEIGSRVDSNCKNSSGGLYQCNTAAEQATDLDTLLNVSIPAVGIRRIYYYQWREPNTDKAVHTWDSGLVSPSGAVRAVYTTLKNRP